MKTIGLIGGISWNSTVDYYRIINLEVNKRLGGKHSAKILLYSLNFADIENLMLKSDYVQLRAEILKVAKKLENGGADLLLLCANTAHKFADDIKKEIKIPLIHIADSTGNNIQKSGIKKVGLLGTKFTMEEDFILARIKERYNVDILIPSSEERQVVNEIIYEELVIGNFLNSSKVKFLNIIENLKLNGAKGIILGCTELPLIIKPQDCTLPLFNTTEIHALAAVDCALS
ncbi:MAG: aspartate/glutamate racemase family protein [Bacteroidetes bacterium]|nr:aspartate/glutamate racemase family protein [Bacteroidota bacterium]MBL7103107.1 aspartate/glutamate racemase family protein [Bacteroidales bacterium]